jgi:hypothetical protein
MRSPIARSEQENQNHMKTAIALLIVISFYARAADPKWQGRVQVNVSGDSKTDTEVSSFVKRELRALGDVTVAETAPDYVIEIIAHSTALTTGRVVGYNLSYVVCRPFSTNFFQYLLPPQVDTKLLQSICTNYVSIEDHQLLGGPDLRALCTKLVASFDSRCLDSDRRSFDMVKEAFRARKPRDKAAGLDGAEPGTDATKKAR